MFHSSLQMSHTILGLQKFRYVKIKCYRVRKYIRVNTHILAHTQAHNWHYNSDNTHTSTFHSSILGVATVMHTHWVMVTLQQGALTSSTPKFIQENGS